MKVQAARMLFTGIICGQELQGNGHTGLEKHRGVPAGSVGGAGDHR